MDDSNLVFRLPSSGDGALKAEIVEWFVAVGDQLTPGQPVCTVETDKSMIDLPAPFPGRVLSLGGAVGEVLEVGAVLLTATAGDPADHSADEPGGTGASPTSGAATANPAAVAPGAAAGTGEDTGGGSDERVSPMVRRLAEEFGVDLDTLTGSGPDGRVTRADVQRAAFGTVIGEPPAPSPIPEPGPDAARSPSSPPNASTPRPPAVPMTTIPTAPTTPNSTVPTQPLTLSHQPGRGPVDQIDLADPGPTPTLTLFRDIEVEQLLRAHERLNATIDGGLPLEALLMRLALPVLVEHPRMNARIDDTQALVPADHYDMAFTCLSDTALVVPVVRQVNDRSLRALGRAVGELAGRAVRGRLAPGETGRQTFTVHNLGPLGVTAGATTLPPGTAALVSYGQARPTLRLVAGAPREVPLMTVAVTVDHRVIDDGEAARFLAKIGLYLEEPILAFTD